MEQKFDVIALGELLIDFTENGYSVQGNRIFEANPGGAPGNVLAMLQKLGRRTAFIGKVGDDMFGKELRKVLTELGIDDSHLYTDPEVPTTLAFVHTGENGERDFSFYRNPGADMCLNEDDIDPQFLKQAKVFHFGTLSMTGENCRRATQKAVKAAKKENLLISFDPNYRKPLWSSEADAKRQMIYGLGQCDILKISDNELQMVTGIADYKAAVRFLCQEYHISIIFLTLGAEGSMVYYKDQFISRNGFSCDSIETTGAGDTFYGTALHFLLELDIEQISPEQWEVLLTKANAAAGLITMRRGALKVMPTQEEIMNFILHEG